MLAGPQVPSSVESWCFFAHFGGRKAGEFRVSTGCKGGFYTSTLHRPQKSLVRTTCTRAGVAGNQPSRMCMGVSSRFAFSPIALSAGSMLATHVKVIRQPATITPEPRYKRSLPCSNLQATTHPRQAGQRPPHSSHFGRGVEVRESTAVGVALVAMNSSGSLC